MSGRRTILKWGLGGAAILAAGGGLIAYRSYPIDAWQRAVAETWQPVNSNLASGEARLMELVRLACLAANSHNTQPWKFRLAANSLTIIPDISRRTPIVDPDDHHLFASLGCAVENIVQAAPQLGLAPHLEMPADLQNGITVQLESTAIGPSPLARMIHLRQCTRANFDAKPVPIDDLKALETVATGGKTNLTLLASPEDIGGFAKLIADATVSQMQDSAFVAELKDWIRFSYGQALDTRDGLFSLCSGNPALPGPVGRVLLEFVATSDSESQRYEKQVKATSGIAIFSSAEDNPQHWFEAGRSYQRFALEATRLGLKHAFVNQPVEVSAFHADLLKAAGRAKGRADLVVRFGYGPEMPRSLR
ncbi:MAG: Tat pathway signal protein, partial [Aestuariivirga sp.]|nr:Tat pathway signal protein [Aestuariivirga sp.]